MSFFGLGQNSPSVTAVSKSCVAILWCLQFNSLLSIWFPAVWSTVDAEIKDLSADNRELTMVLSSKNAAGQNTVFYSIIIHANYLL